MKLIPMAAGVLAAAVTLASAASAAGPLPAPPPPGGAASTAIFDAMLSIARAATSNPAAAQNASFSYNAAIQQYNIGDFERARMSALTALSQTAAVPLPQPSIVAPAIPQPSYVPLRLVHSSDQADAEGYVALARRSLQTCGAMNASPPPAIQAQYAAAVNAILAVKYDAAIGDSQSVVDQCAQASTAYAAQQAALPQPSSTPITMASYSPVPLATLGPDPALQGTPSPLPVPAYTPTPTPRRGFHLF
jgi:hypothetical protein